jgi:hypothetical protein
MSPIDFKHTIAARRRSRDSQSDSVGTHDHDFGAALERRIESARRAARNAVGYAGHSRTAPKVPKT